MKKIAKAVAIALIALPAIGMEQPQGWRSRIYSYVSSYFSSWMPSQPIYEVIDESERRNRKWTEIVEKRWNSLQDEEDIAKLLKAGVDVNKPILRNGNTPLIEAAAWWEPAHVLGILHSGADVNTQNQLNGNTALMAAAKGNERNRAERVRILLEAGADRTQRNLAGLTAEDIARQNGNEEIVRLLQPSKIK